MGRFEAPVEFYRYREPYPAAFFEQVAGRLALDRTTRLLDVGCGPGNLALGRLRVVRGGDLDHQVTLRLARGFSRRLGTSRA